MTAATSQNRPNYFGRRFLFGISENKRLLIVNFILSILGLPLTSFLFITIRSAIETEPDEIVLNNSMARLFPLCFISCGFTIAALLIGMVVVFFNFSYLYKKTSVDMHYSLPLSNRQRFFADYLSGLTVYAVPNTISFILCLVILKIGQNKLVDMVAFADSTVNFHMIIMIFMAMFLFYSVCVLAVTFCGSHFEAIFSTFAYILIVPAFICCTFLAATSFGSFGVSVDGALSNPIFFASNPLGNVMFFLNFFEVRDNLGTEGLNSRMLAFWVIYVILFTLLHTFVAYLLYSRRNTEDVSKPYAYKGFFYALLFAVTFCLITAFKKLFDSIIPGILLSAVIWLIMEIITRRGFKRFWTAIASFAVSLAAVMLITGVIMRPVNKLLINHVPSASTVKGVLIRSEQLGFNYDTYVEDRAVIDAAVKFSHDILDVYNDNDYFDKEVEDVNLLDDNHIVITYFTSFGTTVEKSYESIPSSLESDFFMALLTSEDYIDKRTKEIAEHRPIEEVIDGKYVQHEATSWSISLGDRLDLSFTYNELSRQEFEQLREIYRNDLKKLSKDDFDLLSDVRYVMGRNFCVYGFCTDTIDFIESHFKKLPVTNLDRLITGDNRIMITVDPDIRFNSFALRSDTDKLNSSKSAVYVYSALGKEDYDYSVPTYTSLRADVSQCLSRDTHYIDPNEEGAVELMKRFTPIIFDQKPIAVQSAGLYLIDTPENRALLEKYAHPYTEPDITKPTKAPIIAGYN